MMSEVERHVLETLRQILTLINQTLDCLSEEALVLRLCVEGFAGEFDEGRGGVVAGASEFDEFGNGFRWEGEVGGVEFDNDFVGSRVWVVKVRGVAETEGGAVRWGSEGFGEFYISNISILNLIGGDGRGGVEDVRPNNGISHATKRLYSLNILCCFNSPCPWLVKSSP
jgi:hypothetical protein